MRLIKRYRNRKLYDVHDSRYVTLLDIADFICTGHYVQVVDKETERDLTVQTLARAFLEQQEKQPTVKVRDMHELIRGGFRAVPNRV